MRRLFRWALYLMGATVACAVLFYAGTMLLLTPEQREDLQATGAARREANAIAGNATGTAEAPTITPTPSITLTPTVTDTPTHTAIPTESEAQILSDLYRDVDGVQSVGTSSAIEDDGQWFVYIEAIVDTGANSVETAEKLFAEARAGLVAARVEFSAILDDGTQAIDYTWNNRSDEWQITVLTMTAEPIATESSMIVATAAPVDTRIPRPRNCSTAVAMGLDAQTAAQFGNLDRDNDGVACYGD